MTRIFAWRWLRRREREAEARAKEAERVAEQAKERWREVTDVTDRFGRAAARSMANRTPRRRPT